MNRKSRFAAALLAGALLLGASACGTQGTASFASPVELTVWTYYNGDQLETFNRLVEEFNDTVGRERNIEVIASGQGSVNDLETNVMNAAEGKVGAEALAEALPLLAAGTAPRTPQDSTQATFAPMLSRELSPIDWTKPVAAIRNQVRGLIPWPCATAELAGQRFKIYKTAVGTATDKTPGTLLSAGKKGIEVACGDGQSLWITELQAEGGKRMSAAAYLLGHPMHI